MSIQDTAGKIHPNTWDQGDFKILAENNPRKFVPEEDTQNHIRLSTFVLNAEGPGTMRNTEPHYVSAENLHILALISNEDNLLKTNCNIIHKNQLSALYDGIFGIKVPQYPLSRYGFHEILPISANLGHELLRKYPDDYEEIR